MTNNHSYSSLLNEAGSKYGVDPNFLYHVMMAESGGNPHAGSPAGAQGLFQFMPSTARGMGITNTFDPRQSAFGAAKMFSKYIDTYKGDLRKVLAAYNAGPGAVSRYGGIPPYAETRGYISKILGGYNGTGRINHGSIGIPSDNPTPVPGQVDQKRLLNITTAWARNPEMQQLLIGKELAKASMPVVAQPVQPDNKFLGGTHIGPNWFENRFGLKRSSGDHDAPGVHVAGSYHYRRTPWGVAAYDYGDVSNNTNKFIQYANYAKQHPNSFKEFFYDPLGWYIKDGKIVKGSIGGHGDHLHVAYGE